MAAPTRGADVRKGFYVTAVHILFAIVIGHSFIMASDVIIPIQTLVDSTYHKPASTLMFSYILIVSGWIGYSRSISIRPHRDTALGAMRFVFDLIILFEYFYLLQIAYTGPIEDFPLVVVVIFLTYLLSDTVKCYEYPPRTRARIKQRMKITIGTLVVVFVAVGTCYDNTHADVALALGMDAHILSIVIFSVLVILYRSLKWNLTQRRRRQKSSM